MGGGGGTLYGWPQMVRTGSWGGGPGGGGGGGAVL